MILIGMLVVLVGCGGPALTPLQSQYQREQERARRYHARSELPRALQAYQDCLRWAEMSDDRPAIVAQALNIGAIALTLGEWTLAEQSFQRAQRRATELRDATGQLQAQLGLAQVRLRQGQFEVARIAFQQALEAARDRDVAATLMALNGLGLVQQGLGQWSNAQKTLSAAAAQARTHGDSRLLAATLANQAALALRTNEIQQAAAILKEAVALDRETENLPGLAQDLALLAQVRERQGDPSGAQDFYRQAQQIARHTGQFLSVKPYHRIDHRPTGNSSVRLQPGRLKSAEQNDSVP